MVPCIFTISDSPPFHGFDLGSTWNGWNNVVVTVAVRDQIAEWLEEEGEDDEARAVRALPANGELVSLANGYTVLVEEPGGENYDALKEALLQYSKDTR